MGPGALEIRTNLFYFKLYARFEGCPVFQVYVLKRPHVDEFLKRMGELFECVLFTASLAKVGHPCATVCAYFELLEITGGAGEAAHAPLILFSYPL